MVRPASSIVGDVETIGALVNPIFHDANVQLRELGAVGAATKSMPPLRPCGDKVPAH
jgi:hypothetical protein